MGQGNGYAGYDLLQATDRNTRSPVERIPEARVLFFSG